MLVVEHKCRSSSSELDNACCCILLFATEGFHKVLHLLAFEHAGVDRQFFLSCLGKQELAQVQFCSRPCAFYFSAIINHVP